MPRPFEYLYPVLCCFVLLSMPFALTEFSDFLAFGIINPFQHGQKPFKTELLRAVTWHFIAIR